MVAAPFSMIRLPTVVEPVKEMRSTLGGQCQLFTDEVVGRGDHVDHAGRDVSVLGDQPSDAGGVEGSVRGGLQHDGVAGGERLARACGA